MFASSVNCNNLSTRTINRSHASPSTSDSISNYPATHLHPPPPAATASREHLNSVGLNLCMQKTAAGVQCCSAAGCCMTSVMCLYRVMNEKKCSQGQSWEFQSYIMAISLWVDLGDASNTSMWNEWIITQQESPAVSLHLAARLEISTPGKNGALCAELGS